MKSNWQNRSPRAQSTRSLGMRRPSALRLSAFCAESSLRKALPQCGARGVDESSMSSCPRTRSLDLYEVAAVVPASRAVRRLAGSLPDRDHTPSGP
jgi:L-fucose isomerase-like protein